MKALYEKIGKRYKPVRFSTEIDYLSPGFHLVHVKENGQSWFIDIDPSKVRIKCYVREHFYKEICEVVKRACELRPKEQKLTKKQQKIWGEVRAIISDEFDYLQYSSQQEIVDTVLKKIEELIK